MRNQLVGKIHRVRRSIGALCDHANRVVSAETTAERNRWLRAAQSDCSLIKQSATPSVRKLVGNVSPESTAWWTATIKLANRLISLLEVIVERLDQGLSAEETVAAIKQLDGVAASLREMAENLESVLDLPGLDNGTSPPKLMRPDFDGIQSDLQEIANTLRTRKAFPLEQWEKARAILLRLNLRLGDPKHNSLWRGSLDVKEADDRWLNAVAEFVESANQSFESLIKPDYDEARYMAGCLLQRAEDALQAFHQEPNRLNPKAVEEKADAEQQPHEVANKRSRERKSLKQPSNKTGDESPTEADLEIGRNVLATMAKNPSVESFRQAVRAKGLKGSNAKLGKLLPILMAERK